MRGTARRGASRTRSATSLARVLALAAAGLVAGCADYLNNYDTVTLAAGDAQKHNMLVHTANPFNPQSENTAIESDGVRAAAVIKKYQTGPQTSQETNGATNTAIGTDTGTGN